MTSESKFLQYGISETLASKALLSGLTITQIRATSQRNLIQKYNLTVEEAKFLSIAVKRKAIAENIVESLLERSNFTCNVCKGTKSSSFLIHHIEPYENSQDNSYDNLIVLCPNDHDRAHSNGLTLGITQKHLKKLKTQWENLVEVQNVQKAAIQVDVDDSSIDYVNIKRIEELCFSLFRGIPITSISSSLIAKGILRSDSTFDEQYVRKKLSGGRYLFDYVNSREAEHFKQLLQHLTRKQQFEDLDEAQRNGFAQLKAIEGCCCYFVGGVYSKAPSLPVTVQSPAVNMYYKRKRIRIEWILDPNYFLSMSAIVRVGGKNLFIVYGIVRSVEKSFTGSISVKVSPLLIGHPKVSIQRTPLIAHKRRFGYEEL